MTKTGLKFSTIVQNLDAHCLNNYYLSQNTFSKVQTQSSKDFSHFKKTKPKNLKSALPYNNMVELAKKKNKKKKFLGQKQKCTRK